MITLIIVNIWNTKSINIFYFHIIECLLLIHVREIKDNHYTYMSQHLTISLHLYTEHLVVPQNTLICYGKTTMFHYAAM